MVEAKAGQTKFHGAQLYNERLHIIMATLDQLTSSREGDGTQLRINLKKYFNTLQAFFKELSGKMKGKVLEHHLNTSEQLRKALNICLTDKRGVNISIIPLLDQWEIQLRQFMDSKGMTSPEKLDFSAATGLEEDDNEWSG